MKALRWILAVLTTVSVWACDATTAPRDLAASCVDCAPWKLDSARTVRP